MEQIREKHEYFHCFEVSKEMYEAIKCLPWLDTSEGRDTGIESFESIKVVGGHGYKVAYAKNDGTFVVREAYRFLCEGLVGLKHSCESGGYLVEVFNT